MSRFKDGMYVPGDVSLTSAHSPGASLTSNSTDSEARVSNSTPIDVPHITPRPRCKEDVLRYLYERIVETACAWRHWAEDRPSGYLDPIEEELHQRVLALDSYLDGETLPEMPADKKPQPSKTVDLGTLEMAPYPGELYFSRPPRFEYNRQWIDLNSVRDDTGNVNSVMWANAVFDVASLLGQEGWEVCAINEVRNVIHILFRRRAK